MSDERDRTVEVEEGTGHAYHEVGMVSHHCRHQLPNRHQCQADTVEQMGTCLM